MVLSSFYKFSKTLIFLISLSFVLVDFSSKHLDALIHLCLLLTGGRELVLPQDFEFLDTFVVEGSHILSGFLINDFSDQLLQLQFVGLAPQESSD